MYEVFRLVVVYHVHLTLGQVLALDSTQSTLIESIYFDFGHLDVSGLRRPKLMHLTQPSCVHTMFAFLLRFQVFVHMN